MRGFPASLAAVLLFPAGFLALTAEKPAPASPPLTKAGGTPSGAAPAAPAASTGAAVATRPEVKREVRVATVYTDDLPAGFVRTISTTETIQSGARINTVTTITHYRRRPEPLPRCWIDIPRIRLKARISEGVSQRVMSHSAGHFPHTALPGDMGNCALAAHSNVPGCAYFRSLHRLRPGDRINIHLPDDEVVEYRVANLHVVRPNVVSDLRPTTYRRLTLVTCTLPEANRRLIVVAVGPDAPVAAPEWQPVRAFSRLPVAGRSAHFHLHRRRLRRR